VGLKNPAFFIGVIVLKLTNEQRKIINSDSQRLLVNSVSGSGKTTTILSKIKKIHKDFPEAKILYLAFNKSVEMELKNKIKLDNLDIKTFHALAYNEIGYKYRSKLENNYTVMNIIEDLKLDMKKQYNIYYAKTIKNIFEGYLNSEYVKFSDIPNIGKIAEKVNQYHKKDIIKDLELLFKIKNEIENDVKISHSFYLKLYQLSNPSLCYDYIFVDEAQDLNSVFIDILKKQKGKTIVLVGDRHQQIYSFRHSVNAMEKFNYFDQYFLSKSFRFGDSIADLSKKIIEVTTDSIEISGTNKKQVISENLFGQKTIICRTNMGIFNQLVDAIKFNQKVHLEGGKKSYNFNLLRDIYNLYIGKTEWINDTSIKKFDTFEDLEAFVEDSFDPKLNMALKIVKSYKGSIIFYLKRIKNLKQYPKSNADLVLTTVHKSKGMEYDKVEIDEDFFSLLDYIDSPSKYKNVNLKEEFNLLYVAITRAKNELKLNTDLKIFFENYDEDKFKNKAKIDEIDPVDKLINYELDFYDRLMNKNNKKKKKSIKRKSRIEFIPKKEFYKSGTDEYKKFMKDIK
jgi:superfamily I DNA/RNA helicase